ncbi:Lactoylglutathione lyase [Escovopsis weberi]|uniref:lactoylglutathione lyase n=1 Tax=Escovopsis weberi TaxID=150374 RepID=A0A0M8NA26_ESCWE|nr:Lactoylglutathione lyase [Escovopsis weberi]
MATTTDTNTYKLNHTMLRVKDPKESLKFYEFIGMSLLRTLTFPEAKTDLYIIGYDQPGAASHGAAWQDREGAIELTHNYGTEAPDSGFVANTGNAEPHRGFGHVCISVDNLQAACARIEAAGYRFQKRLSDGRMRNIAFALDPDGYWVEIIGQKALEETEGVTTTDLATYRMNHTMVRVKDAQRSLAWYRDVLGMTHMYTLEQEAAGFNLYFLCYPGGKDLVQGTRTPATARAEGFLELTWNYGTEKDEAFRYHSGNEDPVGYGHICISVDDLDAAIARLEALGVTWTKRLNEGGYHKIAYFQDPDGYWVEVLQNPRYSDKYAI